MISQEQDRPIIMSKVKYLGSCLLPSPIEMEVTIVLYYNRVHIPELDATISIDKISQIELTKGKDLPSQTIMMLGVVGAVVEKENPYMMIKIVNSHDDLLFKFGNMMLADKLVKEIKATKDLQ
jgi:maltose-binding protein MalE